MTSLRTVAALGLLVFAAAAGGAACGKNPSSGGGGASSANGGSGGGNTDCSAETTCGDAQSGCIACAEANACQPELNRCKMSQQCANYGMCITGCAQGDSVCQDDCANQFPVGASAYQELLDCVICKNCPGVCDAPGSGCAP